jgi:tetratricopeptide (TPR) repeat protein
LKRLSNNLQPYLEVIEEILEVRKNVLILDVAGNARVLCRLLKYAEFQFGDRIPGKAYRQRGNSERIDNFLVEINIMIPIYQSLINIHIQDMSLSMMNRENMILPYNEKMLAILEPWSLCIDLDAANRVDSLNKNQIDEILEPLSDIEKIAAMIYQYRNQFVIAESHCQRAISYARRYNEEGETKTTLLLDALTIYCELRIRQGDSEGGVQLAEEAYNHVAVAYNPVQPQVQKAAGVLIDCLIHKGDLYDAERFSQVTLESLKDPANGIDQESEAVANGYYNLGNVINRQKGDLVRAEMLGRESLRIRAQLYGNDDFRVGDSIGLLADILRKQGNLGDEVKELFERSLAIDVKHEGPDGVNTSISNANLGQFHDEQAQTLIPAVERKEHLQLSKFYYTEALRIDTKIFGLAHRDTINTESKLSRISRELSEA